MGDLLVNIKNLNITFKTFAGEISPVRDVSFQLQKGEILGIVGESGSGKSITASALMGLLPKGKTIITANTFEVMGENCLGDTEEQWKSIRGRKVAMIFQDPMTALNPILSIETQIREVLDLAKGKSSYEEVVALLRQVGIANPESRAKQYPHELSGGMRQRVIIAMALAGEADLLLADEPTTALDITTEAQILKLLQKLCKERHMGMIFISHNLRVVAQLCDRVMVMYSGKKVEAASVFTIFQNPQHPYTKALLASIPDGKGKGELVAIEGQPPDLNQLPTGCVFYPRCNTAMQVCANQEPPMIDVEVSTGNSQIRCWLPIKGGVL